MGNVTTAQQSTAPSNPDVNPTVSALLKGVQGEMGRGVQVYNQSLYPGVSGQTQNAWNVGVSEANNLLGSNGFNLQQDGAMGALNRATAGYGGAGNANQSQLMGLQPGYAGLASAYDQDAPGYATLRQNLMNDAVKNVGSAFTSSGRFGGGSYVDQATTSAVDAIAPLDYQNYQNSVNNKYRSLDSQQGIYNSIFGNQMAALGGQSANANSMFGMGQQGLSNISSAVGQLGAVGSARDADMLAQRQADNDLFRRQNDAGWETLAKGSSILGGTAPYAGTDTTKSVPWWAAGLGIGSTVAGML